MPHIARITVWFDLANTLFCCPATGNRRRARNKWAKQILKRKQDVPHSRIVENAVCAAIQKNNGATPSSSCHTTATVANTG